MLNLPVEIVSHIFDFFQDKELFLATRISKRIYDIITSMKRVILVNRYYPDIILRFHSARYQLDGFIINIIPEGIDLSRVISFDGFIMFPYHTRKMVNLKVLTLRPPLSSKMGSPPVSPLSNFPNLREIYAPSYHFPLRALVSLPKVEKITAKSCILPPGRTFKYLRLGDNMSTIVRDNEMNEITIKYDGVDITDEEVSQFDVINTLIIRNNSMFTGRTLKTFKQLKSLKVSSVGSFDIKTLKDLDLTSLSLYKTCGATDEDIKHLTNLQNLSLFDSKITHSPSKNLICLVMNESFDTKTLKTLTKLDTLRVSSVTVDSDIAGLTGLKVLDLRWTKNITGSCFKNFGRLTDLAICHSNVEGSNLSYLRNLTCLIARNYNKATDDDISKLNVLKKISVNSGTKITIAGIRNLPAVEGRCSIKIPE